MNSAVLLFYCDIIYQKNKYTIKENKKKSNKKFVTCSHENRRTYIYCKKQSSSKIHFYHVLNIKNNKQLTNIILHNRLNEYNMNNYYRKNVYKTYLITYTNKI